MDNLKINIMGTAEQAYFERNRKGFEGDSILRDKVKAIVKKHKIDLIIETGTYLGSTTKVMAEWVDQGHASKTHSVMQCLSKIL